MIINKIYNNKKQINNLQLKLMISIKDNRVHNSFKDFIYNKLHN